MFTKSGITSLPLFSKKQKMEAKDFYEVATNGFDFTNSSNTLRDRRYRSIFGVSAHVTSIIWNIMIPTINLFARPIHLLWTLYFLKQYSTEHNNAYVWNCTEKTFRKWCWYFIEKISNFKLVCILIHSFPFFPTKVTESLTKYIHTGSFIWSFDILHSSQRMLHEYRWSWLQNLWAKAI